MERRKIKESSKKEIAKTKRKKGWLGVQKWVCKEEQAKKERQLVHRRKGKRKSFKKVDRGLALGLQEWVGKIEQVIKQRKKDNQ